MSANGSSELVRLPNESAVMAEPPATGNPIDLRQVVQILIDRWWLLLLIAGLAGAAAFRFTSTGTPVYQSKAILQVAQEEQRLLGIDDVLRQDLRGSEVLNTIVANMKNSTVMLRVVRTNQLTTNTTFVAMGTNELSEERAAMILAGMVNCKLRKETRLIDLVVTHKDPIMARKLADSVAQEFIRQNLDQRYNTSQAANERLFEEAARLKQKLERSERALQDYKEQHQVLSVDEHGNTVGDKLASINRSYSDAKAARVMLEADLQTMRGLSNNVTALLTLPSVLSDSTVAALRPRVIEKEATVQTMAQRYKDKWPAMAQAKHELEQLRQSLQNVVLGVPATLQASYEEALAREKSLEDALKVAQKDALSLSGVGIQFHVLQRDVESDRAMYDSVLKRLKETDVTKGFEKHDIAIVEPAGRPVLQPTKSRVLMGAMAACAALFGGFALLVMLNLFDSSFRTVDSAEQQLGLPVVATVPVLSNGGRTALLVKNPYSPEAEAFRTLRAVSYSIGACKRGSIHLFTSAIPGEGKTFSSLNYALCMAQEGRQTLLVDLDLRNPTVGKALGLVGDFTGASDFIVGRHSFKEVVRKTPYPNLSILTAGRSDLSSGGALTQESVQRLLDEAARHFERVVIDSAPINCVGDTLLILPSVNLSFLVVHAGTTPRRAVTRALELMARCQRPPKGIILNFMPARAGFAYYYSYGQGYYGQKRPQQLLAPAVGEQSQA